MKKSKEETLAFRLQKSDAVLNEAKSLIINKQWEGAANDFIIALSTQYQL